jgi:sugar phosphate isomerase/epimerase
MYMGRLVTLASGQFGDLALADLCRLAKEMGYDGLELATHAHFNVQKALHDPSYLPMVHETLNRYGLVCRAISAHLHPPIWQENLKLSGLGLLRR